MQYFQKLIGKEGGGLGYSLGEVFPSHSASQIWTIQRGEKKEANEQALIFTYDPKNDRAGTKKKLAQNGLQRLKTFRHPDILKFLSSSEGSDGSLHVATETATPLAEVMRSSKGQLSVETVQWGLVCIARALGFLHSGSLVHGSFGPTAIFVTPSGDWKLGSFEATFQKEAITNLRDCIDLQPEAYRSPEVVRGMWSSLQQAPVNGLDSWALGCLIYAVHAGSYDSPEELRNINKMPKALLPFYQRLLASDPSQRALCSDLPEFDYFKKARFVELNLFLDNLAIKDAFEKEAFLKRLPDMMEKLPRDFCVNKVLPVLCTSFDLGIGGTAALTSIVKVKSRMTDEEFKKRVVDPHGTKWFANATYPIQVRMELLQNIGVFAKAFDAKDLNDKVFPSLCAGLADQTSPALRDLTVKTCVHIAPLLSDRNLNSVLMSKFAGLQVDPEPAIRTNTTVCIGKLAASMNQATRQKVLVPAFVRALKDPFPPARSAGLVALTSTQEYYSLTDIATKLYPAIGPVLIDPETEVRGNAFKLLKGFQAKLEENNKDLAKRAKEKAKDTPNGAAPTPNSGSTMPNNAWGFSGLSTITSALIGSEEKQGAAASTTSAAQGAANSQMPSMQSTAGAGVRTNGGISASSAPAKKSSFDYDQPSFDDAGGDDGWGDDDEFDDMLDKATTGTATKSVSGGTMPGLSPGGPKKVSSNNDVWGSSTSKDDDAAWGLDPFEPQKSTTTSTAGAMGTSARANQAPADMWSAPKSAGLKPTSKSKSKKADDDWESILGGTTAPKKKSAGLGAIRR